MPIDSSYHVTTNHLSKLTPSEQSHINQLINAMYCSKTEYDPTPAKRRADRSLERTIYLYRSL